MLSQRILKEIDESATARNNTELRDWIAKLRIDMCEKLLIPKTMPDA